MHLTQNIYQVFCPVGISRCGIHLPCSFIVIAFSRLGSFSEAILHTVTSALVVSVVTLAIVEGVVATTVAFALRVRGALIRVVARRFVFHTRIALFVVAGVTGAIVKVVVAITAGFALGVGGTLVVVVARILDAVSIDILVSRLAILRSSVTSNKMMGLVQRHGSYNDDNLCNNATPRMQLPSKASRAKPSQAKPSQAKPSQASCNTDRQFSGLWCCWTEKDKDIIR
jgi:hypothetical protein